MDEFGAGILIVFLLVVGGLLGFVITDASNDFDIEECSKNGGASKIQRALL